MFNKNFYPTPSNLISRMKAKIKGNPHKILEPSAGKGDIVEALIDKYSYHSQPEISAIEANEELQATLRGKNIKVIDSDFLTYSGQDKFDLIIGNPPFDNGDRHLLKAIEIMYRGEIVFLLNAETLRNPHTNTRRALTSKLSELNAEIEYIDKAFTSAERPTGVEIALVYINIERTVEEDLFADMNDKADVKPPTLDEKHELSIGRTIEELVADYNNTIQIGIQTIVDYYRHFKKVGKYIGLNKAADADGEDTDLTGLMQNTINKTIIAIRVDFWRKALNLDAVRKRMTSSKQEEFETQLTIRSDMDFTEANIRQFILNIIGGYEKTLIDATLEIFDKFTIKHCFSDGLYDKNIHMFNGWKTNKAFKVNKKVIMPIYGSHGSAFIGWMGGWSLNWGTKAQLDDIDKVMNYFDGMSNYKPMSEAIEEAFKLGESSRIKSTYFTVTVYKKGTIHLTFNSSDILRRFNVAASKGKNWLPDDYGARSYSDLPQNEKEIVDSFDGEKLYTKNLNMPTFAKQLDMLQLTQNI